MLNPIRLMIASLERSRNSRGLSLPGWARAVTVPSSTKPKPSAGQAFAATPSLSIPAASPTADGKSTPNTLRGLWFRASNMRQGAQYGLHSADRAQGRKRGVVRRVRRRRARAGTAPASPAGRTPRPTHSPLPHLPRAALINFDRADQLAGNVTRVTRVNDFVSAVEVDQRGGWGGRAGGSRAGGESGGRAAGGRGWGGRAGGESGRGRRPSAVFGCSCGAVRVIPRRRRSPRPRGRLP